MRAINLLDIIIKNNIQVLDIQTFLERLTKEKLVYLRSEFSDVDINTCTFVQHKDIRQAHRIIIGKDNDIVVLTDSMSVIIFGHIYSDMSIIVEGESKTAIIWLLCKDGYTVDDFIRECEKYKCAT